MKSRIIKMIVGAGILSTLMLFTSLKIYAHCEIPCGIYGDKLRIKLIREHIMTIEKSMKNIVKLSKDKNNPNQTTRWIMNKEVHVEKLQDIVSRYFLHQRIKPLAEDDMVSYKKYTRQLAVLHRLLVFSMKCKQSVDLSFIADLRKALSEFEELYFHPH